jgi:hypothetical protein
MKMEIFGSKNVFIPQLKLNNIWEHILNMLFNANSAIFSAMPWREQVNFQWDDDEVRFELDQHT